jgi:hypothetical protein
VDWFHGQGDISRSTHVLLEQKIMIVLWLLATDQCQRDVAHKFMVSQSTISEIVNQVLPCFDKLHNEYVTLPQGNYLAPEIELDPRYEAFSGCIGAVDGSHIQLWVPNEKQKRRWYSGKSKTYCQNIFAAVKFNGQFTYVLAGAEGSIHDSRLCSLALLEGFVIPSNRYYLADDGFNSSQRQGMVMPYPRVRYHIQDWHQSERQPRTSEELYNRRHATLRVIIENAFGRLKKRWAILGSIRREYDIWHQVSFVYATTALHNFIRIHRHSEDAPAAEECEQLSTRLAVAEESVQGKSWAQIREGTRDRLWQERRQGRRQGRNQV